MQEKKTYLFGLTGLFCLYLLIHYWDSITRLAVLAIQVAVPLFLGFVISYIVNIIMNFYEAHLWKYVRSGQWVSFRRAVSITLAYLTLVGIVALIIGLVVPELIKCVRQLFISIPDIMYDVADFLKNNDKLSKILNLLENIGLLTAEDLQKSINQLTGILVLGVGNMAEILVTTVTGICSAVFTTLIAVIFSIYILAGKEKLGAQCVRLLHAYLPRWAEGIFEVGKVLDDSIRHFVVGQCAEAVILGTLCIIGMLIFRFPYAVMIGVLVGFTALIPVAGAYIGAGIGAVMIFTVSPVKTVFFLVFLVVLQQIEGNVIYPRVVGNSIGLPGIWVLAAVIVGGGLSGVPGMLAAVPLTATIYRLLQRDIRKRILRKNYGKETLE